MVADIKLKKINNILELIKDLRGKISSNVINIGFIGYTDLMITNEQWSKLGIGINSLDKRENFEKLKMIHGWADDHKLPCEKRVSKIPTLQSALKNLLGSNFSLTVFDFTQYEGSEVAHDFNLEIPECFTNKFDIIIDKGTCEHIFNFPQALINITKMLKTGGYVYQSGPMIMPNHGFYSYNPTLFFDFYNQNGCEIADMCMKAVTVLNGLPETISVSGFPVSDRFMLNELLRAYPKFLPLEWCLEVLAKKNIETDSIIFPIQGKYSDPTIWT